MPANTVESSQDVREMASKDPSIRVQFVDDDELQILQQLGPLGVVRQDPGVQHVGIAENDMRATPNRTARILRRIPIVGMDANLAASGIAYGDGQCMELRELILGKRLGWK